ncbi:MAG: OprO/OprP family phosphate-selective porin [Luteimonas sp.]
MKRSRSRLSVAMFAVLVAPTALAEIPIDRIAGSDISFEGLLQTDGYWYDNDFGNLDADPGDGRKTDFGLRRAEIGFKGKGPGNVEWAAAYDASGDGKLLDAFAKYTLGSNSNRYVQVGQFKQPNSLEELSSTKNNDFVSKAMVTSTFAISRRLGVAAGVGDSDWGVTASAFGRELTRNRAHGSGFGARGYWAPINQKGNVLHLGLSYVDYDTDADTLRLRVRPDADLANRLIDTGNLTDTDRVATIGFEGMWIKGPLKVQAEYMASKVSRYRAGSGDFSGTGGYVSGVWNVTGETWRYKGGTPSTSLPDKPGSGMWKVGLRYDNMDLDDSGVLGGRMDTLTAGVNWYWRTNFKFVLNYVKVNSTRRGVSDDPDILEARAQIHW